MRQQDTRPGEAAYHTPSVPLSGGAAGTEVARNITYNGITIPASAQAIVGNMAVVNNLEGSRAGHVTLYPSSAALPTASNLNYAPGQVIANAFTVGLGGDGAFDIHTYSTTDLVVDLTGYFAP